MGRGGESTNKEKVKYTVRGGGEEARNRNTYGYIDRNIK
jgi:hypothetical protein